MAAVLKCAVGHVRRRAEKSRGVRPLLPPIPSLSVNVQGRTPMLRAHLLAAASTAHGRLGDLAPETSDPRPKPGTPEYEECIEAHLISRLLDEEHPVEWYDDYYNVHLPDGTLVEYSPQRIVTRHPDGRVTEARRQRRT